ncbi:MAG: spore germination protein [Clostridia bacterium]|nr:spore germination protein [Clostridia bacterium]
MIRKFLQWLKYRKVRSSHPAKVSGTALTGDLNKERQEFERLLGKNSDIKFRAFTAGGRNFLLLFVDGMVNMELLNKFVILPIQQAPEQNLKGDMKQVAARVLGVCDIGFAEIREAAASVVLYGDGILLMEGCCVAATVGCKGFERRGVEQPQNETVVRGPKESFTENLRTNTTLLRRKIRSGNLTFEDYKKGRQTDTQLCLVYMKNLTTHRLLCRVRKRIEKINIDMILETGYVEQLIEDHPTSIFSTVGYTEKPDVAAAKLLEGRVLILVDGTPFVLTLPFLLVEAFQNPEDYYEKPVYASMIRVFRVFAFLISIFAPALFVALTTFHQELIPTALLFTMAAAREGIPFTAFSETVVMLITFEVLREAGLRLPRAVGQTISIVGALVMGDAAVAAGLVGAPLVITVALTAVCAFVVPTLNPQQTLLRWLFLFAASMAGGLGIALGAIVLFVHLISLRSFGFPYLSPVAPLRTDDLKDSVIRSPLWLLRRRPVGMAPGNPVREDTPIPGGEEG